MQLTPIGHVKSTRTELEDDGWDQIESSIELDATKFTSSALKGLEEFSHIEVLFWMHKAKEPLTESRHPRGNTAWPQVGIFAQRAKDRPNKISVTICQLVRIDGLKLFVKGLDAVDGTPIVDIKPWVAEFGPRGVVRQPSWMSELMREYWGSSSTESVPKA